MAPLWWPRPRLPVPCAVWLAALPAKAQTSPLLLKGRGGAAKALWLRWAPWRWRLCPQPVQQEQVLPKLALASGAWLCSPQAPWRLQVAGR